MVFLRFEDVGDMPESLFEHREPCGVVGELRPARSPDEISPGRQPLTVGLLVVKSNSDRIAQGNVHEKFAPVRSKRTHLANVRNSMLSDPCTRGRYVDPDHARARLETAMSSRTVAQARVK